MSALECSSDSDDELVLVKRCSSKRRAIFDSDDEPLLAERCSSKRRAVLDSDDEIPLVEHHSCVLHDSDDEMQEAPSKNQSSKHRLIFDSNEEAKDAVVNFDQDDKELFCHAEIQQCLSGATGLSIFCQQAAHAMDQAGKPLTESEKVAFDNGEDVFLQSLLEYEKSKSQEAESQEDDDATQDCDNDPIVQVVVGMPFVVHGYSRCLVELLPDTLDEATIHSLKCRILETIDRDVELANKFSLVFPNGKEYSNSALLKECGIAVAGPHYVTMTSKVRGGR